MAFIKRNYDDSEVREFSKKFLKEVFDLNFDCHSNSKAIDLINVDDETIGAELEKGGWSGNFWSNDYSLMSGLGYRTINIPIRKAKYWYNKVNDNLESNENKHIFVRTNKKFTQVILIRPETIKDKNKIMFTEFTPNNSNELEKWMSFREEHVETYNLIDEKWELQKNDNVI